MSCTCRPIFDVRFPVGIGTPEELLAFLHNITKIECGCAKRLRLEKRVEDLEARWNARNVLLLALGGRSELTTNQIAYDGLAVIQQFIARLESEKAELMKQNEELAEKLALCKGGWRE